MFQCCAGERGRDAHGAESGDRGRERRAELVMSCPPLGTASYEMVRLTDLSVDVKRS